MGQISGACAPEPGPESGPPGMGAPAGDPPLRLIERAMVTALACVEETEANLASHAGELPTTRLEQAVLEARVGALTAELRAVRDAVATLTGRVGRVGQAGRGRRRVDDDPSLFPSIGTGVLPVGTGGGEPPVSRREFMTPRPGMQARAVRHGVESGGDGGGDGVPGTVPGRLRARGFGSIPGAEGGPE